MSPQLEDILDCIYEGRVPSSWLKGTMIKKIYSLTCYQALIIAHFSSYTVPFSLLTSSLL